MRTLVSEWLKRRRWRAEALVLACLAGGPMYGYDLWRQTGLRSGRLYPVLWGLEDRGVITSGWGEPTSPGGPRRRWYRLVEQ